MKASVLFVLHMPPPVHGAAMVGQYIHDSELINSAFDCHYINLATASGLEDIGQFKFKKVLSFWNLLKRIRHSIKELKPDDVYITPNAKGAPFYKDFIVVMMLKRMGCKVIAHYHNKGVASRQDKLLDNLLYKQFFKDIKVILLSERLYPDIQKYVRRENVYVSPNGIPERNEERKRESQNTIPHILFLSNLLIEKGVLVLLDALRILKEKGFPFICDMVGGETAEIDSKCLDNEIRGRGLQTAVLYHGKRYGAEKNIFFKNADMFVFPTFNECFPLVLLEAMQHSLPIITTDEGGIPDIVKDGENGLICDKKNPEDLANAIEKLLKDNNLRSRMGQNGYQRYRDYFTLQSFEKKLVHILQSVE
jgi:glycosyltransferase involved in cell wall biosynthesis